MCSEIFPLYKCRRKDGTEQDKSNGTHFQLRYIFTYVVNEMKKVIQSTYYR